MQLVDVPAEPPPPSRDVLKAITAEAVILQDKADEVLAAIGRGEHLGLVAPRGGPLVRRFLALRDQLPAPGAEPQLAVLIGRLDTVLLHHAMQIATAMDFLAVDWRSEKMARYARSIRGLGAPARVLDDLYAELRAAPLSAAG